MSTRTRKPVDQSSSDFLHDSEDMFDLESLSEEELEEFLFEPEEEKPSRGIFNLPTIAGLSIIMVGVAYIFQQAGLWSGFDLSILAGMLPWIAGVFIILLGFGVLTWRPQKKKKRVKKSVETTAGKKKVVLEPMPADTGSRKRRLEKSRNKKIFGVCAGIADYFNIDPTLVRIAFVIGTIATQGPFLIAYLVLAMVMPNPRKPTIEERITILRDS